MGSVLGCRAEKSRQERGASHSALWIQERTDCNYIVYTTIITAGNWEKEKTIVCAVPRDDLHQVKSIICFLLVGLPSGYTVLLLYNIIEQHGARGR